MDTRNTTQVFTSVVFRTGPFMSKHGSPTLALDMSHEGYNTENCEIGWKYNIKRWWPTWYVQWRRQDISVRSANARWHRSRWDWSRSSICPRARTSADVTGSNIVSDKLRMYNKKCLFIFSFLCRIKKKQFNSKVIGVQFSILCRIKYKQFNFKVKTERIKFYSIVSIYLHIKGLLDTSGVCRSKGNDLLVRSCQTHW